MGCGEIFHELKAIECLALSHMDEIINYFYYKKAVNLATLNLAMV